VTNYSTILTRCILVSCIALLAMSAFPIHPALPFLIGITPLLWYHLSFLRPIAHKEGLSQAAIDSVYYYGFLVTIAALAASSLQLAIHGIKDDLTTIAFQFGLGLIATGYAVWARIHLTSASQHIDEAGPEEMLDRYLARSRELLSNVELATSSFSAFAEMLTINAAQISAKAQSETLTAVRDAAAIFKNEIVSIADEGRLAIGDLRGLINDVGFEAEREGIKQSTRSITTSFTNFNKEMQTLSAATSAGAVDVGHFAGALALVRDNANSFAGQLDKLTEEQGSISRLSTTIDASAAGIGNAGHMIATALGSVRVASQGVNDAMTAMTQSANLADEVRVRLVRLAKTLASLDALGDGVDNAASALARLGEEGVRSGIVTTELATAVASLRNTLLSTNEELELSGQRLSVAMAETDAKLRSTLDGSTATVEALSARLATVAEYIIERTNDRQKHRATV
jgi:hypothetical protein